MVKLYKDDKIFNPETGRYVKITGTIGRRLQRMSDEEYNNLGGGAGAGAGVEEGGVKEIRDGKIKNPSTGRMVMLTSTLGRRLVRMSNEEYTALFPPARPARPARPGRPDRPARPGRPDRPGRPGRPDRPVRPVRPARPEPIDLALIRRTEQARAIVRGVQRADEYMRRYREQVVNLFNELPNVVLDEVAVVPVDQNIRDTARLLMRLLEEMRDNIEIERQEDRNLERQETEVERYEPRIEGLERDETISDLPEELRRMVLERAPTGEERFVAPRARTDTEDTEEYIQPEEALLEVAERLKDVVSDAESEGVEESKIEDVIVEQIQQARRNRLDEIFNNAQEGDLSTEEEWDAIFKELYELEPVEDDKKTFRQTWEEFADDLEKMFDEMLAEEKEVGVEEEKEEQKQEEEKEDVDDELTRLMGLDEATLDLIMNSGRGAHTTTTHVPDPHLSAFEHIERKK